MTARDGDDTLNIHQDNYPDLHTPRTNISDIGGNGKRQADKQQHHKTKEQRPIHHTKHTCMSGMSVNMMMHSYRSVCASHDASVHMCMFSDLHPSTWSIIFLLTSLHLLPPEVDAVRRSVDDF